MTDTSDMADTLSAYIAAWDLSGVTPLSVGRSTSSVYEVRYQNAPAVLKILTDVGIEDESGGAVALACWDGEGAVRLLNHDGGAHLIEYADGEDLKAMVHRGEDERATAIIGDVLNKIHGAYTGAPPPGLTPLRERFSSLFEAAAERGPSSIYARAAIVAEKLLSSPLDAHVLHGDMHHENVIHCEGRGWLAIDPKGVYGERIYDATSTVLNAHGVDPLIEDPARIRRTIDSLAGALGVDPVRLLRFTFAGACLSASWSIEDEENPAHALKMAGIMEPMLGLST